MLLSKKELEDIAAWNRGIATGCRLCDHNEEYVSFTRTAEALDRLAEMTCAGGYICNGGHTCTSDHK